MGSQCRVIKKANLHSKDGWGENRASAFYYRGAVFDFKKNLHKHSKESCTTKRRDEHLMIQKLSPPTPPPPPSPTSTLKNNGPSLTIDLLVFDFGQDCRFLCGSFFVSIPFHLFVVSPDKIENSGKKTERNNPCYPTSVVETDSL